MGKNTYTPSLLSALISVILGVAISTLLIFILSLPSAAVVYFSNLAENTLTIISLIIQAVAIFIGSVFAARYNRQKGMLIGLATAGIVLLLCITTGSESNNIMPSISCCLPASIIGGIIGVNRR